MKKLLTLLLASACYVTMSAQAPDDWYHQDPADGYNGISVDKTFYSTGNNILQLKPSKKALLEICKLFQCNIKHTLFIGDREDTDGESARMAGMQFLRVNIRLARKGVFYSNLTNLLNNGQ